MQLLIGNWIGMGEGFIAEAAPLAKPKSRLMRGSR